MVSNVYLVYIKLLLLYTLFLIRRVMSMASHCEQVCIMERLRQEVLLLHGRVASQDEVIETLHTELRESVLNRQALEKEFELYRKKMKEKMISLMEGRAKSWLEQAEKNEQRKEEAQASKVTVSFTDGATLHASGETNSNTETASGTIGKRPRDEEPLHND